MQERGACAGQLVGFNRPDPCQSDRFPTTAQCEHRKSLSGRPHARTMAPARVEHTPPQ